MKREQPTQRTTPQPLGGGGTHNPSHQRRTIDGAPSHEIHMRPVPQSTDQHDQHRVGGGGHAGVGGGGHEPPRGGQHGDASEHKPTSKRRPNRAHPGQHAQQEAPRDDRECPVATEGDVHVVAPPLGETHVPTSPELSRRRSAVGEVEVSGQMDAQEPGHALGHVGVAAEIRVHLKAVPIEGHQDPGRGRGPRVVERRVHEPSAHHVAQQHLLHHALDEQHHKGFQGGRSGVPSRRGQLGQERGGPNDGACHQLREEREVGGERQQIGGRGQRAAVHVDQKADGLEREKRDAKWQHPCVQPECPRGQEFKPESVVDEERVFERRQPQDVQGHPKGGGPSARRALPFVNELANAIVEQH